MVPFDSLKGEKVTININQILENPNDGGNLTLVDGDSLIIPKYS
ncbi:MAG: hypothetical protein R2822_06740 [Spirosomataceae bacterium]